MALTFNKHLSFICWNRAGNTGRGQEGHVSPPPPQPPPHFGIAKRKGKQKKYKVSKQKLLKSCHQDQNVTILAILEHLEFKLFFLSASQGGRPVLFSVPWPFHLEIHFARPVKYQICLAVQHLNIRTILKKYKYKNTPKSGTRNFVWNEYNV